MDNDHKDALTLMGFGIHSYIPGGAPKPYYTLQRGDEHWYNGARVPHPVYMETPQDAWRQGPSMDAITVAVMKAIKVFPRKGLISAGGALSVSSYGFDHWIAYLEEAENGVATDIGACLARCVEPTLPGAVIGLFKKLAQRGWLSVQDVKL